ncbi:MAG: aminotransferase class IV [Acidobacteriota bacterium]
MGIRVNVDGRLGTENDRLISPLDQGFVFGASVYETVRTYHGRPFLLDRHLERLRRSAAGLNIAVDLAEKEIVSRVEETLAAAANAESYIRIIVSAGLGALDYRVGSAGPPTVVVLVKPLPGVPSRFYREGIRAALVDVVRNHPQSVSPHIKSSNLLNNLLALREADACGAEEALMLNYRGELAEGSRTNVFIVKDGVAKTPSLDAGILAGVTRDLVISVARERQIETRECRLLPGEVFKADEVFLTATGKEILPVVAVSERVIGDGMPGPVTLELHKAYREKVRLLMDSTPQKGRKSEARSIEASRSPSDGDVD